MLQLKCELNEALCGAKGLVVRILHPAPETFKTGLSLNKQRIPLT